MYTKFCRNRRGFVEDMTKTFGCVFSVHSVYTRSYHPSDKILFQRTEPCVKLFQKYFRGLLHSWIVSDMFDVAEIILK